MANGQVFGDAGAPNSTLEYWDSVTTSSLNNYRKTMKDNISKSNAILAKTMATEAYEAANGGKRIVEELMHALSSADSYSGYDELPTTRTDGITQAEFTWAQTAVPIMYSGQEMRENREKFQILNLVKSRIMQAELGLKQYFKQGMLQGNGAAALATPKTSLTNASTFINPLFLLLAKDPTATAAKLGGIDPSVAGSTFWRNQFDESGASTYLAFLQEMFTMYNNCSKGPGGPPNLIMCDQKTYELYVMAYHSVYRMDPGDVNGLPFEAKKFKGAAITWDEDMPDLESGLTNADMYGTMAFLNTQFVKLRFDPQVDFELLRDERGVAFQKPYNGDYRVAHLAWAGQLTTNNRRKNGVLFKIARTMS